MAYCFLTSTNISQGDACLPYQARGRQCVPCSLMFLIFSRYIRQEMQGNNLHNILLAGSQLYCAIDRSQDISGFIDPKELPDRVHIKGHKVYVQNNSITSGFVGQNVKNDGITYYGLEIVMSKKVS